MPSANVYNMDGEVLREESLDDYVFGAPVNTAVLHQVITAQLVNRRQGTADTKTRAEVSGGNKKPYRQKGTGRARQGSTRAPHFTGGGAVFGPHPHPYERAIPRKVKRLAIRSALSDKAANGRILLVENLTFEEGRTREMETFLADAARRPPRADRHAGARRDGDPRGGQHPPRPYGACLGAERLLADQARPRHHADRRRREDRPVVWSRGRRRPADEAPSACGAARAGERKAIRGKAATAVAEKPAAEKKPAREKKR